MSILLRRSLHPLPNDRDTIVLAVLPRIVWRGGVGVYLSPTLFRTLMILLAAGPRLVTHDELFDCLYDGREDGGPYDKIISVMICRLRKQMAPLGIIIENVWGQGFRTRAEACEMRPVA